MPPWSQSATWDRIGACRRASRATAPAGARAAGTNSHARATGPPKGEFVGPARRARCGQEPCTSRPRAPVRRPDPPGTEATWAWSDRTDARPRAPSARREVVNRLLHAREKLAKPVRLGGTHVAVAGQRRAQLRHELRGPGRVGGTPGA